MRHTDVFIAGIATVLGELDSVESAVERGDYDPDDARDDDLASISVIPNARPTEVAATAFRDALNTSPGTAHDVRALVHTGIHFQGQDYWTPAAHVARLALGDRHEAGRRITTMEVRQASNGGVAALNTAALYTERLASGSVAVTAADVFHLPHFDRYRSDKGLVLGDGGAAVVLGRTPGIAALRSTALIGDPGLEPLYAGDAPRALPNTPDIPLDLRGRKDDYLLTRSVDDVVAQLTGAMEEVLLVAADDANCKITDIDRFVFPNTGRGIGEWKFLDKYGIDEDRTCWEWGRTVGHVGAADQLAGLHHLISTDAVGPGSRVALCSSGIGFNWGAAIVEILT